DARRAARRTPDGRYVPLSEQDPGLWSMPAIVEAETELDAAAQVGRVGRFQLEAAIQSVHAERAQTGPTDWAALLVFYEQLGLVAPTLGARVAQAAAVAEAQGPGAGLALLDTIVAPASPPINHSGLCRHTSCARSATRPALTMHTTARSV